MPGTELVQESRYAMMPLNRTCKEVAALLVAREDRRLPLKERVALRIHMVICEACPKFERQMLLMRSSMQMWRNYTVSDDSFEPSNPNSSKS
jgi:hypothetical protein